ncbi:glycosyltransferase family 2 protein [Acidobacteriota bacterium]
MNAISIIIPVYNEENILHDSITFLISELDGRFKDYEIILSENGSIDNTKEILQVLGRKHEKIKVIIDEGVADYGQALINGISSSKYNIISILEIDYLDIDFLERSYQLMDKCDFVIGSKKISKGIDQRPWKRRMLTGLYNYILRWMFHLTITETHGLKTFNKQKLRSIVNSCVTKHAVFPSELTIRAAREKSIHHCEIPLSLPLREVRTTRISAKRRFKKTIADLLIMRQAIK